jgi:hypothetical protein
MTFVFGDAYVEIAVAEVLEVAVDVDTVVYSAMRHAWQAYQVRNYSSLFLMLTVTKKAYVC